MERNEIKKEVYRQKPTAILKYIRSGVAYYFALLVNQQIVIQFEIPVDDMGDADFYGDMEAKLLLRWLV